MSNWKLNYKSNVKLRRKFQGEEIAKINLNSLPWFVLFWKFTNIVNLSTTASNLLTNLSSIYYLIY